MSLQVRAGLSLVPRGLLIDWMSLSSSSIWLKMRSTTLVRVGDRFLASSSWMPLSPLLFVSSPGSGKERRLLIRWRNSGGTCTSAGGPGRPSSPWAQRTSSVHANHDITMLYTSHTILLYLAQLCSCTHTIMHKIFRLQRRL